MTRGLRLNEMSFFAGLAYVRVRVDGGAAAAAGTRKTNEKKLISVRLVD